MKVIVLGAGVIGVTTAYYLAKTGAEVTVIDRHEAAGLDTSFANAGQISPGYSTPWAAPGVPLKALKWLFQKHAPLSVYPDGSVFQVQWLLSMLANCTTSRYDINKERMLRLAGFSRECLVDLRSEIGNHYEGRQSGTLQVFRTSKQLEAAKADVRILEQLGIEHQLLASHELTRYEPHLCVQENGLTGALRLPLDETGDCFQFTQDLAKKCKRMGVKFLYGHDIVQVTQNAEGISGVVSKTKTTHWHEADQYVLAMGSYSRELALSLGLSLPVYPLKGYSLTIPIVNKARAPQSTVMDETYKVAVTRFEDRIRVGGMAEIAGFSKKLRPQRRATLEKVVSELFPQAGALDQAQFWTGLRPMTPDSTPIVGRSGIQKLWLNTGHGTLGWTMACGSGKLLSQLIEGAKPSIDTSGLDALRYKKMASFKMENRAGPKPITMPA